MCSNIKIFVKFDVSVKLTFIRICGYYSMSTIMCGPVLISRNDLMQISKRSQNICKLLRNDLGASIFTEVTLFRSQYTHKFSQRQCQKLRIRCEEKYEIRKRVGIP